MMITLNKSFIGKFDHIVSHFDGNNNDEDDIAALPIAALLTNAAGVQKKSTFFYNNNLGEPNESDQVIAMQESAAFAEKLGIETYNYQANINATTNELVKILNSGKTILAIEGGPMEAIYRALEKTSSENRKNITLLSHSSWNESRDLATRPDINDVRTWIDIQNSFPEVELKEIRDQNGKGDNGFNSNKWVWLDNTSNPLLQEARDLMANAQHKINDPSDAGMHFYALTGIEDANPNDAKAFFNENPPSLSPGSKPPSKPNPKPNPPKPNFKSIIIEAENWSLSGEYRIESIVAASGKKAISLKGGNVNGKGKGAFSFKGPTGKYDIKLSYFDENDGIGKVSLKQGKSLLTTFNLNQQLGSRHANYKTLTQKTIADVQVKSNDRFTLEGFENGKSTTSEHTRIDRIEFIPDNPSDSTINSSNNQGLKATYFRDKNLRQPVLNRIDSSVDFFWGASNPALGVPQDNFSVRWSGFIVPEYQENYRFQTTSDDGVRLWVGDQLLIDNWTQHSQTIDQGSLNLKAGNFYPITMEYFENKGQAVAQLKWSSNSQNLEIVPQEHLFTTNPADMAGLEI